MRAYTQSSYRSPSLLTRMAYGGLAGFLASGPMGLLMVLLHRWLPTEQQYHLPPRQITMEIAKRTGVERLLEDRGEKRAATWISHFGYGAAAGALYPILTGRMQLPAIAKGMLFSLVVWMGSYLGWIPASGILPPATEQPAGRNVLMIVSHLLWGSIIGLLVDRLEK